MCACACVCLKCYTYFCCALQHTHFSLQRQEHLLYPVLAVSYGGKRQRYPALKSEPSSPGYSALRTTLTRPTLPSTQNHPHLANATQHSDQNPGQRYPALRTILTWPTLPNTQIRTILTWLSSTQNHPHLANATQHSEPSSPGQRYPALGSEPPSPGQRYPAFRTILTWPTLPSTQNHPHLANVTQHSDQNHPHLANATNIQIRTTLTWPTLPSTSSSCRLFLLPRPRLSERRLEPRTRR